MSAIISPDLVDLSAFADVHRIEVFCDLVLLFYPHHSKFYEGPRTHALAPLMVLEEPIPAMTGPIRPGTWTGASAIAISRAGALPDLSIRHHQLERPVHHPVGTAFFLLDAVEFKHFVRLSEFCRLAFDARCRACVVFNDLAYIVTPVRGTGAAFMSEVRTRFPKSKSGCGPGEITGFSMWNHAAYSVPALSAHLQVESIRRVPPLTAVADSAWSWVGPLISPKPRGPGDGISI